MIVSDQRGKNGQQRKFVEEASLEIKKRFESFQPYKSCYSRKDTEKKYYFPFLSIDETHRLYVTRCTNNNLQPKK